MKGPTIKVIKYTTKEGRTYYEEAPQSPLEPLVRQRVERARNSDDPIVELTVEDMPEEDYWKIPATVASAQFFGQAS